MKTSELFGIASDGGNDKVSIPCYEDEAKAYLHYSYILKSSALFNFNESITNMYKRSVYLLLL